MFKKRKSEVYDINISGLTIEVSRKRIKNLYVRVNRYTGAVRVSCPINLSEFALEQFIRVKFDWIQAQKSKAASLTPKIELSYVKGERIFFEGKEYRLDIKERAKKSEVRIKEESIILCIRGISTLKKREEIIEKWYRSRLKERIPILIEKYQSRMGVKVLEFRVKKMKTRWGTCNIQARRIWLNLELMKKSQGCLEMVVVHEMVHLLERLHSKRFYKLMDRFMPDWKMFNKELNSTID